MRRPAAVSTLVAAGWSVLAVVLAVMAARTPAAAQPAGAGPGDRVSLIVQLRDDPIGARFAADLTVRERLSAAQVGAVARYADGLAAARRRLLDEADRQGIRVEVRREYGVLFNGLALSVDRDDWPRIARLPGIQAVYLDEPLDIGTPVNVSLIGAPALWTLTDAAGRPVTGVSRRVAILDTGIDYTHPDLGGGYGPAYKVAGGYDFVNDDLDPMDDHGHGTFMAGVVAASGTITGVAPGASLLAYKVLSASGSGVMSDMIAALERAADPDLNPATSDPVDAVNISVGGLGNPDSPVCQAVDRAVDLGIVVVAASGREGSAGGIAVPAVARQAIAVVASDNADQWLSLSNRGPVPGFYLVVKPDLTAPGQSIPSTFPGGGYDTWTGTGAAAAHVAGAAALVKQLHPEWTAEMVKANLMNTARDLGRGVYEQGAGRLDLVAAANAPLVVLPGSAGLGLPDVGAAQLNTAPASAALPPSPWEGLGEGDTSATLRLVNVTTGTVTATASISTVLWAYPDLSPLPAPVPVSYADLYGTSITLGPSTQASVTIRVSVPGGASPGYYTGEVAFSGAGYSLAVPFTFAVLPRVICPDFVDPPGVGVEDIQLVAVRWPLTAADPDPDRNPATPNYAADLDMDGDGDIDTLDVMRVAQHWEELCR